MTMDVMSVLDGDECILRFAGVLPAFSDKYDITKQLLYK